MAKHKQIDLAALSVPDAIERLTEAAPFSGMESLALAGRQAMAKHVSKLYAHLPGVLNGDDPHDIHQMRVATRRLRASLTSTAPAYRAELVEKLYQRLRRLARALGDVRDRDVQLIRLRRTADEQSDSAQSELRAVIERVQAERDKAHAALLDELQRRRTQRLLRDLTAFLTDPLDQVQAKDHGLPLLVHHHAGSVIWRRYESIRRFETVMPHASSERLHQLRIACKHLRYTLELFEPALGEDARALIKQVEAMQEHLGDIHDADVALSYFGDADAPAAEPPHPTTQAEQDIMPDMRASGQNGDTDVSGAITHIYEMPAQDQTNSIQMYLETRRSERQTLLADVEPLWRQLSGDASRRKLTKLLAAL
jgi:CHAD domain-containing protein